MCNCFRILAKSSEQFADLQGSWSCCHTNVIKGNTTRREPASCFPAVATLCTMPSVANYLVCCRFWDIPIGKNTITELLPNLFQQVGVTICYTARDHSLRATFTNWTRNAGLSDNDIMPRTEHKVAESLASLMLMACSCDSVFLWVTDVGQAELLPIAIMHHTLVRHWCCSQWSCILYLVWSAWVCVEAHIRFCGTLVHARYARYAMVSTWM